jgi:hypothetical protein
MHPLAAELLAEDLGMLLNGEQEYLLESFLGHYRVPVTGQRQPALVAEISQRMEVLADALLLLERDPTQPLAAVVFCLSFLQRREPR